MASRPEIPSQSGSLRNRDDFVVPFVPRRCLLPQPTSIIRSSLDSWSQTRSPLLALYDPLFGLFVGVEEGDEVFPNNLNVL